MDEEIWLPVSGYEEIYRVSNLGRVKSIDHFVLVSSGRNRIQKGRMIKADISSKGYTQVSLSKNKSKFHTGVHRLVAIAFIENNNDKPQVNHIDGNKQNNRVENLEWCTNQENQIHAVSNNLISHNTSDKHHMSKLTNTDVRHARYFNKNGFSTKKLSVVYNVTTTAMHNILNNKTYINI